MPNCLRASLVLLFVGAATAADAQQVYPQALRPVVETRYRRQPAISWRPMTRTFYQPAARVEAVPVTTFRNVVVDEGGFRAVWVPRPVVRTVAQRSFAPRLRRYLVPVQVTRPVAQPSLRLVPEHRIRFVPQGGFQPVMPRHDAQPTSPSLTPRPDPAFEAGRQRTGPREWGTLSAENTSATRTGPASSGDRRRVERAGPDRPVIRAPSAANVWQTRGIPIR